MPTQIAAGLLMCRWADQELEYFLVHPGGPFFINKDLGVWSIPKGLGENKEDLIATAQREFYEETGLTAKPPFYPDWYGEAKRRKGSTCLGISRSVGCHHGNRL